MGFPPGSVVIANFPFSDEETRKRRPCIVIASFNVGVGNEVILAMVTTGGLNDQAAIPLSDDMFLFGSMADLNNRPSRIRPLHIFTVPAGEVKALPLRLNEDSLQSVRDALIKRLT